MKNIVQLIVTMITQCMSAINKILTTAASALTAIFNRVFGFLAPVKTLFKPALNIIKNTGQVLLRLIILSIPIIAISLLVGKIYQNMDRDPDRGAIAVQTKSMGENYNTPVYVDQGWSESDSLWFYNTTQGSNLLPYDFFVELEVANSEEKFISPANIDALRYLPQKATFFNPDALPVGLVKDTYQNEAFVGLTCAACHTSQVNFNGNAVRIDGGPAGADMVAFLSDLEKALKATLQDSSKFERFAKAVIKRDSFWRNFVGGKGYSDVAKIRKDLEEWTNRTFVYNTLNSSKVDYGFSRLDAFGRIYNRVLEHVLERDQIANRMAFILKQDKTRLLSNDQVTLVLEGLDNIVIGQKGFELLVGRLYQPAPYPDLNLEQVLQVRDALFNVADAPVSYPFLWDIAQSDYVQWNGLAGNPGLGPLGRNAGEVIGVFGTLDWKKREAKWWEKFSFSGLISGQTVKKEMIDFKSSIDKVNLTRLESHLRLLQSPLWEDVTFADGNGLPAIDQEKSARGKQLYSQYCQACHEIIVRDDWDRRVVAKMMSLEQVGTDPKMAKNSVNYTGSSGNFASTYQATDVGTVIIEEQAPVVQILTSATKGVIGTEDADKWPLRRFADWLYTLAGSLADNPIKASVKSGDYNPDTTSNPYASLEAYKGRSLNGIWATAPFLHNGSVPTLYDLLLPNMEEDDPQGEGIEYRPEKFMVGCRELDAQRVGFKCSDDYGQEFDSKLLGNSNAGHEYAAGKTNPLGANQPLPALNAQDRWALVEFIKTL